MSSPNGGEEQLGWLARHRRLCETRTAYNWCVGIVKLGAGGMLVTGIASAAGLYPQVIGARDSLVALFCGYACGVILGFAGCGSETLVAIFDAKGFRRWPRVALGGAVVFTFLACASMLVTLLLSVTVAIGFMKNAPSGF